MLVRITISTAAIAGLVLVIWVKHESSHAPAAQSSAQAQSFRGPFFGVLSVIVIVVILYILHWRARNSTSPHASPGWSFALCAALLVIETATLLTATPNLWPSSNSFFATTPAERTLQQEVGTERVAMGTCTSLIGLPADIGILPDANGVYGVSELAVYDPVLPQAYFNSYSRLTGTPVAHTHLGMFCPSVGSASVARHYGAAYVLQPSGMKAPTGTRFVKNVGDNEVVYRVPGAGIATLEGQKQKVDSPSAKTVPVRYPTPSSIMMTTSSSTATTLYVHVTDVPGWHVSVDGRPAPFEQWDGLMIRINLPSGRHVVTLNYEPSTFVIGTILAGTTFCVLIAWILINRSRRERFSSQ